MDDLLSPREVERLLGVTSRRMHGNGVPYRNRERDVLVLRLMLEAGLTPAEVAAVRVVDCLHMVPSLVVCAGRRPVRTVAVDRDLHDALHVRRRWALEGGRERLFEVTVSSVHRLVAVAARRAGIVRAVTPGMLLATHAMGRHAPVRDALERIRVELGLGSVEAVARFLDRHRLIGA